MNPNRILSLLFLFLFFCILLPFTSVGQTGDSLYLKINPAKVKGSMKWWKTWRPMPLTVVPLRATLYGEDIDINGLTSTRYVFTLPTNEVSNYRGKSMNSGSSMDKDVSFRFEDQPTDNANLTYIVSNQGATLTVTCKKPQFPQVQGACSDGSRHKRWCGSCWHDPKTSQNSAKSTDGVICDCG